MGHTSVRLRWGVIAAWLVVAIGLHLWAAALGQQWNDDLTLPGTGSTRATDLLQQKLPQQAPPGQGDGNHEQERPGKAEPRLVLESDPPTGTPEPEE